MRKGLILGLLVALVMIAAVAALLYRPVTVIGTSGKSLAYSLRQEAGSDARAGCEGEGDRFTCALAAAGGGGLPFRYDVEVDDYGCWDAKRKDGEAAQEPPGTLSGCITIVDLVRTDD